MQRANAALTGENEPDQWRSPVLGGMMSGALKSASSLVGNILDMTGRAVHAQGQAVAPQAGAVNDAMLKHTKDAADWLRSGGQPAGFWENVGAVGEQVLEYLGTDGILKLAGPAAGAGVKTLEAADHLKQAQNVANILAGHPKLAGLVAIGLKASKDAAMLGTQTYLHTEDPEQAATAGAIGGGTSAVASLLGAGITALKNAAPTTTKVGEETVPVMADQLDKEGGLTGKTATKESPAIAAEQQKSLQAVTANTAKRGAMTAIDKVNATRGAFPAAEAGAPQLPAGEGAQPFTFTLETTPPTETPTGEMAHSAAQRQQAAFKDPHFLTESAPTRTGEVAPGGRAIAGAEGATGADIRTGKTPEAAGETVGGGGTLTTTKPAEAQQWLQQIEDLQKSAEYQKLPEAQQSHIEDQRQALEHQLGIYHASPYGGRFAPDDIWESLNHTESFGDAAAQVKGTATPVYQVMDAKSGGEFSKARDAAKQAMGVIERGGTMDAIEQAQKHYDEAQDRINEIFTRHGDAVSRTDYLAAKQAWYHGSTFDMLHAVTEGMANGVTRGETAGGLPRIVKGNTKVFENFLAKANNRERVQQLIGQDGIENLKKMMVLTSDAKLARGTSTVLRETARELEKHVVVGGMAGGALGRLLGGWEGSATGAAAGVGVGAATFAAKQVMRYAAVSPRIGNMVDFAVRNGLSPEHYAPLIARSIAETVAPAPSEAPQPEPQGEPTEGTQQ
jgi:hypothetical protein